MEGPFRRNVARFGVPEHDVDDVMSETFLRLFKAEATVTNERELLSLADAVARRVVLDWMRKGERRARMLARHGLTVESLSERVEGEDGIGVIDVRDEGFGAAGDPFAAEHSHVLRLAVDAKLRELSRGERRAVALLRRGGPYLNREKQAIHRARKRLGEVFHDLRDEDFGIGPHVGGVALVARWRDWLGDLRSRWADPNPFLPVLAGAASAAGLAGLAVSAAAPGGAPPTWGAPASPARSAVAMAVATPPAASPVRLSGRAAVGPVPLADSGPLLSPPPPITVATRLPEPGRGGVASISLGRDVGAAGGTTNAQVIVYCDTAVRQAACGLWGVVPATPE
jgi:DNA-directed RNA polymerase specialized sigma24 family protein